MGMHRARVLLAAAAIGTGAVLGAPSASADSGTVFSRTGNAIADFWDLHDKLSVCDRSSGNRDGAIGIIEVRQADGRFKRRATLVDNRADGACVGQRFDVVREASDVRLGACDYRSGVAGNCRWVVIPG